MPLKVAKASAGPGARGAERSAAQMQLVRAVALALLMDAVRGPPSD